jgi:hypothetical protein
LALQISAEHREQRALVDTCQLVVATHRALHALDQVANELVTVLLPAQTEVFADACCARVSSDLHDRGYYRGCIAARYPRFRLPTMFFGAKLVLRLRVRVL